MKSFACIIRDYDVLTRNSDGDMDLECASGTNNGYGRAVCCDFHARRKEKPFRLLTSSACRGHELVISFAALNTQQINHVAFSLAHVMSNKNSKENLKVVDWPIFTIREGEKRIVGGRQPRSVLYFCFYQGISLFYFERLNFIRPSCQRGGKDEKERERGSENQETLEN